MDLENITPEEIDKHREIYPLEYNQITFYSSFHQILGKSPKDYTPEERKNRWKRNMELLKEIGCDDSVEYWNDISCCESCQFLDKKDAFCKSFGLPVTYNPITTHDTGMIGMACMGIGRQNKQIELFETEN